IPFGKDPWLGRTRRWRNRLALRLLDAQAEQGRRQDQPDGGHTQRERAFPSALHHFFPIARSRLRFSVRTNRTPLAAMGVARTLPPISTCSGWFFFLPCSKMNMMPSSVPTNTLPSTQYGEPQMAAPVSSSQYFSPVFASKQ